MHWMRGAVPVLASRDAARIAELARNLSPPPKLLSLDAPPDVAAGLGGIGLVLCRAFFQDRECADVGTPGHQGLLSRHNPARSMFSRAAIALIRMRKQPALSCARASDSASHRPIA
jgi:hypothetical protein